ncbi:zinc finger protein 37 isoform X19 [Biomphalaria glabrata]|nr:zinc finger protein 37 isoform X19 [Biomphalaria glabrata]
MKEKNRIDPRILQYPLQESLYTQASKDHNVTECPHCQEKVLSTSFKTHLSQFHGNKMPFQCQLCGKGRLSMITQELQSFPKQASASSATPHKCAFCNKTFVHALTYRKHLCESHGHLMPFCCKICGKGVLSRQNMLYHMQAHKGKTFSCPDCGTNFKLKHHLLRHVRAVHYLNMCSKCLGTFKDIKELNVHMEMCKKK